MEEIYTWSTINSIIGYLNEIWSYFFCHKVIQTNISNTYSQCYFSWEELLFIILCKNFWHLCMIKLFEYFQKKKKIWISCTKYFIKSNWNKGKNLKYVFINNLHTSRYGLWTYFLSPFQYNWYLRNINIFPW